MPDVQIVAGGTPVSSSVLVSADQVTILGDGSSERPLRVAPGGGQVVADQVTILGNGLAASPLRVAASFDASVPYVDLRKTPYNVVANEPDANRDNTAAIRGAIADWNGSGARLALPGSDVYCGRFGTSSAALLFGTGVSKLTFAGQGMEATTLIFDDASFGGDWHGIVCDGSQQIEICDLGVKQISDLGADGQQHHLIRTAVTGVGGVTSDILYHNIYFGSGGQLCDAFQIFGNTGTVTRVRLLQFLMKLDGIGLGARSGIAVQRGYSQIEFGFGNIRGAKNSLLDMESTGVATIEYAFLHDLILDNSLGQTSNAMSISGVNNGANLQHCRVRDVTVLDGRVSISDTDDCHIQRLNVIATTPWPADTNLSNVQVFNDNNNLVLEDLSIERSGTAAAGRLLDIQNEGIGVTIRGGLFKQATADFPIYFDGSSNVKITGKPRIEYSGGSAAKAGVFLSAVSRNSDDVQIDGIDLVNTGVGGNLRSIVDLESRVGMSMNRISVTNCDGNGTVANGVYLSFGAGSVMDPTPYISNVRGWVTAAWKQVDESDDTITTLFPCVSGVPGCAGAQYVGDESPEGALTAPQGSMCIFRNGDATEYFRKNTGTAATGWATF